MCDPKKRAWLHMIRWSMGMSQAELAKAAGVSQRALSAYENGTQTPRPDAAMRLARVLPGVEWTDFYSVEQLGGEK